MRCSGIRTITFVILASSLAFGVQTRRFTKNELEYELELPSATWQVIPRLDVHGHVEFINGKDAANGHLRLRKILLQQPTDTFELFRSEEKWELQRLQGYVVCSECEGTKFEGDLSGAVFSYEYVSDGRIMHGRIYYLQIDQRTFYSLHFTVAGDKFQKVRGEIDFIAQSFHLK